MRRGWSKDDTDVGAVARTPEKERSGASLRLRRSALGSASPEARDIATLDNADLNTVISAVSKVIHLYAVQAAQIDPSADAANARTELFDEAHCPLDNSGIWVSVPSVAKVHAYLFDVQENLRLPDTCIVLALVFLERAVFRAGFVVSARTWRVSLLVALVIAAKVAFDEHVFLGDFRERLAWLDADLAKQEAVFLDMIDYSTVVKARQYAHYYYALLDTVAPGPAARRKLVLSDDASGAQ